MKCELLNMHKYKGEFFITKNNAMTRFHLQFKNIITFLFPLLLLLLIDLLSLLPLECRFLMGFFPCFFIFLEDFSGLYTGLKRDESPIVLKTATKLNRFSYHSYIAISFKLL